MLSWKLWRSWCLAIWLGAGTGCATAGASAAEVEALRDQVATLRRDRQAEEKRIEALESQFDAEQAELLRLRGPLADAKAVAPAADAELPASLQVVHLRREAMKAPARVAPPLPTDTPVREPDEAALADLEQAPSEEVGELSGSPDALFDQAFEKLKTGDLVGAASDFQGFAAKYPRDPAADNALLDEGIALYGLRRYDEALAVLGRVEARYPAGDAVPEALWRAADCEEHLGRMAASRRRLAHLVKDFASSPEAVRARGRLAPPPGVAAARDGG